MDDKDTPGMIETQLRAWGAELDRLKAKVERQMAESRKDYYEAIEELREDIEGTLKKWGKKAELTELRRTIETELAAWQPEIEALRGKAGRAEAEAKKLIDELKARRKALKHASGGAWADVKTGASKAWDELRPALQSAISKFK
jgi:DNA repair exonuclease SbcCD ATPase subunit